MPAKSLETLPLVGLDQVPWAEDMDADAVYFRGLGLKFSGVGAADYNAAWDVLSLIRHVATEASAGSGPGAVPPIDDVMPFDDAELVFHWGTLEPVVRSLRTTMDPAKLAQARRAIKVMAAVLASKLETTYWRPEPTPAELAAEAQDAASVLRLVGAAPEWEEWQRVYEEQLPALCKPSDKLGVLPAPMGTLFDIHMMALRVLLLGGRGMYEAAVGGRGAVVGRQLSAPLVKQGCHPYVPHRLFVVLCPHVCVRFYVVAQRGVVPRHQHGRPERAATCVGVGRVSVHGVRF